MSSKKSEAVSKDNIALLRQMILSQNIYLLSKMKDKKFRESYVYTMTIFYDFIRHEKDTDEYDDYIMLFNLTILTILDKDIPFFERHLSSSKREGELLAVDTVKQIIESINTRFISGGHRLYEDLLKKMP